MILDQALKIEEYLECPICDAAFLKTTIVGECGHVFCLKCITTALAENSVCPTCQKPADINNLIPDSTYDNLLVYIDNIKNELLSHPLTPLEFSLKQQQMNQNQERPSQSEETPEEYQIEDSSMDDLPTVDEILQRKRTLPDTDTQNTANDEEELEKEFNDSLSQDTFGHAAKKFKTYDNEKLDEKSRDSQNTTNNEDEPNDSLPQAISSNAPGEFKPSDNNEKLRMLHPKNILGDLFSFSQGDELLSQSQKHESSAMASASSNSENDAIQAKHTSVSEDQIMVDEPMPQSDQSTANATIIKDFIPDIIYSDSEDNTSDTPMWTCSKCEYPNKPYLQTCGICHSYRNKRASDMPPPARPTKKQSKNHTPATPADQNASTKEAYPLTVAADEENTKVHGTLTIPNTRKRSDSVGRKEVHILYTGLTPEDEKKLDKIKEETDQKLKIVIHYQMRNFDDVTHIITSVDKQHLCKRTLKYLQGVLKGKWIVEPKWVIDSTKAKKWQLEDKYEVQGDHLTGKTYAPKLARESKPDLLFEDMRFYFFGDFTGKHNKNDMLILCRAGGAKILNRKPPGCGARIDQEDPLDPKQPIVIQSSDQKKKPVWLYQCQVRDPQWIIDCISKFKVE